MQRQAVNLFAQVNTKGGYSFSIRLKSNGARDGGGEENGRFIVVDHPPPHSPPE